ncbi:unnamed protein product [Ostreobium quekettii]|uniref:Uncharacterized protein n=1 Tax=Ostreobium quekettii TaxID=121088 RepID=A0A8S1IU36_9CHLO|nr:unnamed protein product [Ostreobium quekettii]
MIENLGKSVAFASDGKEVREQEDNVDNERNMGSARRFIVDSFDGVSQPHPRRARYSDTVLHGRLSRLLTVVAWGYVFLTCFQLPEWCTLPVSSTGLQGLSHGHAWCKVAKGPYPTINPPFVSRSTGVILELCIQSALVFGLYLRWRAHGRQLYGDKLRVA